MTDTGNKELRRLIRQPYRWIPAAAAIILLLVLAVLWQRWHSRRRAEGYQRSMTEMEGELERRLSGAHQHIEAEFASWRLTDSEREVGWMLLKGLSFREVSAARGTSERTSRQQARAIYAKSGLASRSELSAYFLEDLVFGSSN